MSEEYKEYWFEVTGKVYATSPSHAAHFVFWAMEEAHKYGDASHASLRIREINGEYDDELQPAGMENDE